MIFKRLLPILLGRSRHTLALAETPEVPTPHRLVSGAPTFVDRPFAGQGASLYVTAGSTPVYRNTRLVMAGRRAWIKGATNPLNLAADVVAKTTRVAEADGTAAAALEFEYTLPAALFDQTIAVNVRHFRDDVENLDQQGHQTLVLDGSGNGGQPVGGAATMLGHEVRSGGIVRLRWRFRPFADRAAPARFRITFTAGPTSPADLTLASISGETSYELDTLALSDAGPYTITLSAEDDPGTDTVDLVTGYQFTADATGPAAPTLVSAEVV